jgi:hypothetical protein
MWRRRIRVLRSIALRTLVQRLSLILLLFCLVNAAWSIVGGWSISLGGESFHLLQLGKARIGNLQLRRSLRRCHSQLALCGERAARTGLAVASANSSAVLLVNHREHEHQSADVSDAHGIIDDRPRILLPGLLLNWQDQSRGEWHNRGDCRALVVACSLAAVVPALALVRYRRRAESGQCGMCGYDLRATPGRCPECGAVTALGWPAT